MAIDLLDYPHILAALEASDWSIVLTGVGTAQMWLEAAAPGDPKVAVLITQLVRLAAHTKWEVRRAVANTAATVLHPSFESAIIRLVIDDNTRVRQAAERAALRRRDWQNASTLGRQHQDRINHTLDGIETRFGVKGRDAVKRAAEQIADTFVRELYHEIIKLLSPIATSAERLQGHATTGGSPAPSVAIEAERIGQRIAHLGTVLDSMRAYTEVPKLTFKHELVKDVLEEAASLVRDRTDSSGRTEGITVVGDPTVRAEIVRSRVVQALTNLLTNAVEAYEGMSKREPIAVQFAEHEGHVVVSVTDHGCGMSKETLADSVLLFATNKRGGTGFGLPFAVKIVESEHSGRVHIESELGLGTSVRLQIPVIRLRLAE